MSTITKERGNHGEMSVAQELKSNGFTIIARNYTSKLGEIDIIAQQDELVIFVEVKMRSATYFDLSSVITRSKQRKIIATAKWFIAQNYNEDISYRFDVALVEPSKNQSMAITYLADAFREDE